MADMNILVLCLSRGYGGLELYAAQEIRQLLKRGHTCIAVVTQGSMLDMHLQKFGIQPCYLDRKSKHFPYLAAKNLKKQIEQHQIEILHIHWNDDLNLAALTKKMTGRQFRLVYSRHMAITRSKRDIVHRWFYREVDKFIVVTKLMRQEAEKFLPLPPGKIAQLYLGAPDPGSEPVDYSDCFDESFPRRRLNVALFGRVEYYKGQHLLIEAIERLIKENLDVSAAIIGHVMDEAYFSSLKDRIQKQGLGKYVKFSSFVSNPVARMRCYDAIVLATYCETFGLVLIEAMRANVMVIGTSAGGVKEIIQDGITGLMFEPGNSADLAGCIRRIYDDRKLALKIARNGKSVSDEKFSDELHFVHLEKLLVKILAEENLS